MLCQTILISCLLYLSLLSFITVSSAIENAPEKQRPYVWSSPKNLSPKKMKKFLYSRGMRSGIYDFPKNDFNKVQYYDSLPVHPRMTISPDAELLLPSSASYYDALLRSLFKVNIGQPMVSIQARTHPHDSSYGPSHDSSYGFQHDSSSSYGPSHDSSSSYGPPHDSSPSYGPPHDSSSSYGPQHDSPSGYEPTHEALSSYGPSPYSPSSGSSSDDPSSAYSPSTYDHAQYSQQGYGQEHADYSHAQDDGHPQPEYEQSPADIYASYYGYPSQDESAQGQYTPVHPGYVSSGTPHGTLSGQSPAAANHFYSGYGGSQTPTATETSPAAAINSTTTASLRALFQNNRPRYLLSYG